jgi:hypothetical protein
MTTDNYWKCFCGNYNSLTMASCTCGRPKVSFAGYSSPGGVEKEHTLHDHIIKFCKENGWLAFHGSMAHKTFRTEGEPDFVILAPQQHTLLVECKSKTGKPTTEQLGIAMVADRLGHTVHFIRSTEEFDQLAEAAQKKAKGT